MQGSSRHSGLAEALNRQGYATLPLLDAAACRALAALYHDDAARFRSRVVMQRHNYGRGEYKYLAYPLPERVAQLRAALSRRLAPIANGWRRVLGEAERFPPTLDGFLAQCHAAGQSRPTPLLLRYTADDYNCLHQDLYGDAGVSVAAHDSARVSRAWILPAASSFWSSSGRAPSRARRSCRWHRGRR